MMAICDIDDACLYLYTGSVIAIHSSVGCAWYCDSSGIDWATEFGVTNRTIVGCGAAYLECRVESVGNGGTVSEGS